MKVSVSELLKAAHKIMQSQSIDERDKQNLNRKHIEKLSEVEDFANYTAEIDDLFPQKQ